MILSGSVNDAPPLKGYGFGLSTVYLGPLEKGKWSLNTKLTTLKTMTA